jgi:hypothetical protein
LNSMSSPTVLKPVVTVAKANQPRLLLLLCLVAHTSLSIDRGLMAVLQAIKRDLLLSDSQLGMIADSDEVGHGFQLEAGH